MRAGIFAVWAAWCARRPTWPARSRWPASSRRLDLARAEWEHIHRVLTDCQGNVSEAARRLGILRQSLQRRLRKHAPLH